jgi:hypothetical protein
MEKWLLLALAVGSASASLAQGVQPVQASQDPGAQTIRAQKRIELRTALSEKRNSNRTSVAAEPLPAARQLSPSERAEMREQLRRYQPEPLQWQPP